MNLEQDIEPYLSKNICNKYWDEKDDHTEFRAIIKAIDRGGGQLCDVVGILEALDKAGFIIKKMKS